jgi:hypothetical protein
MQSSFTVLVVFGFYTDLGVTALYVLTQRAAVSHADFQPHVPTPGSDGTSLRGFKQPRTDAPTLKSGIDSKGIRPGKTTASTQQHGDVAGNFCVDTRNEIDRVGTAQQMTERTSANTIAFETAGFNGEQFRQVSDFRRANDDRVATGARDCVKGTARFGSMSAWHLLHQ